MSERCKKVLMEIFECGEIDIDILLSIDTEILIEVIGRLKEERAPLNFPNVFREVVETAIDKFNLRDGVSEVDGNYAAAAKTLLRRWLKNF